MINLVRHGGPDRTARLPAGQDVRCGVHSDIAEHYGVDSQAPSAHLDPGGTM